MVIGQRSGKTGNAEDVVSATVQAGRKNGDSATLGVFRSPSATHITLMLVQAGFSLKVA